MSRRPSSLHGLLALLLAAVWVAAPLAETLHGSTHAHRYCAEHDAIEEGGEPSVAAQPHVPSGPAVREGAPEGEADHEACPLIQADGRRGILSLRHPVLQLPSVPVATASAPSARPHAQLGLLFVAPKLSPPRA